MEENEVKANEADVEKQIIPVDPTALTQFIELYEKHYGVCLDPGAATVKARRLLSLFRLIAAHADKRFKANMEKSTSDKQDRAK